MDSGAQLQKAWVALTVTLAIHVLDEAIHDFLSVYNPIAESIRQQFPWLPLPVFQYEVWLGGLIGAIFGLFCLSAFVPGHRGMARAAVVFALLMMLNGGMHLAGSLYEGRVLPGTWSAPLLVIAGAWLLSAAVHVLHPRMPDAYASAAR